MAAAALMDELVEEILLRIPPDDPARLLRAALVCKRWCRIVSDPGFRRRFREFHRTAPMLGLLCSCGSWTSPSTSFVSTTSFRPSPGRLNKCSSKLVAGGQLTSDSAAEQPQRPDATSPPSEAPMPPSPSDSDIDPRSGYCAATGTFHSLRSPAPLPSPDLLLSFPAFLPDPLPTSGPALVDAGTGEAVSFPAFLSRTRALAAALRSRLRLVPGDVAFVLSPAGVHVPVLYYALMAVGAVVSPANPALTAAEVSRLLALSKPRVAFAVEGTRGKLPPGLRTVLLDSPTFLSFLHEPEPDPHQQDGNGAVVVVRQSDPAAVLYSSGTTGHTKAVVFTHRNLMPCFATRAPAPEVVMLTVPLFHVYGFIVCLMAVSAAHTLVLHTTRRFDAAAVLAALGRFGVTRLTLAPPALLAIVRAAEEDAAATARVGVATLKVVTCAGAHIAADLIARFSRKFPGVSLVQGYGLTETTSGFCRAIGEEEIARVGSVGRLSWGAQVKIVHPETGAALPPGVPGELWVRGSFVMKGYLGEEDSTSEILDSEGWLRTGDLCYIDQDGFVYIVDRLKELIKYKGYQVAPAELESLLQTHPDIDEAAVVPYPDDEAGELPVAFVVRRPGSHLHESHVKEFVTKQVVHYKRIHHVFLVDSIPKNAVGKILRKDLAKLASRQHISSKL